MVPVKEVAFWSRDYFERSRHEREKVVERSRAAVERGDMSGVDARPLRNPGKGPALDDPVLYLLAHLEVEMPVVPCCRHVLTAFPGGVQGMWQQHSVRGPVTP